MNISLSTGDFGFRDNNKLLIFLKGICEVSGESYSRAGVTKFSGFNDADPINNMAYNLTKRVDSLPLLEERIGQ